MTTFDSKFKQGDKVSFTLSNGSTHSGVVNSVRSVSGVVTYTIITDGSPGNPVATYTGVPSNRVTGRM